MLDPTGDHTPVPFSIQPSSTLDGSDLQALDLRVLIHGPNIYSGYISLNGNLLNASRVMLGVLLIGGFGVFVGIVIGRLQRHFDRWRPAIR